MKQRTRRTRTRTKPQPAMQSRHASFRLRSDLITRIDGEAELTGISRAKRVEQMLDLAYITIEEKRALRDQLVSQLNQQLEIALAKRPKKPAHKSHGKKAA